MEAECNRRRKGNKPGTPRAPPAPLDAIRVFFPPDQGFCDARSAIEEKVYHMYQPHVVFLDITLPGIDGFEVARRMRREPSGCGSVLVALTGYGQPEDRHRSMEAGFQHHLVKPVTFGVIQNLLATVQPHPETSG